MKKTLILTSIVLFFIGLFAWSTYNDLITIHEEVNTQWAQVENQYQRRFDLIPNLVESVKGIMKQENDIFGQIADARTRYAGSASPEEKAASANQLEGALARLLVVMENYPELKSANNVNTLMSQLEGTENRVSVERNRYNELVKTFNIKIKRIPARFIASFLGFEEIKYFEATAGSEEAPKVSF